MLPNYGDKLFLSLVVRHERTVAQLYKVLSDAGGLPGRFWKRMLEQKLEQVELLVALIESFENGRITIAPTRTKSQALKISLDKLEPRINTWKSWGSKHNNSIRYAIELERSMSSFRSLTMMHGKEPFEQELLTKVETKAREHLDALEQELDRTKSQLGTITGIFRWARNWR